MAVMSTVRVPMVPPALREPLPYLVDELKEGNRSLHLRPIGELNSVKDKPQSREIVLQEHRKN